MREILFRGKRDKAYCPSQDWTYGVPFIDHEGDCIFKTDTTERVVDPETVGQYTGLKDKNGKKIFEGDICRNTKTGEIVYVAWHGTMAGYVWSRQKEGCKHLFDFGALFRCFDKYEVIGNIHDNPELLKGE
jgi:uncharacterized phage protein (TIGR01671 family)